MVFSFHIVTLIIFIYNEYYWKSVLTKLWVKLCPQHEPIENEIRLQLIYL